MLNNHVDVACFFLKSHLSYILFSFVESHHFTHSLKVSVSEPAVNINIDLKPTIKQQTFRLPRFQTLKVHLKVLFLSQCCRGVFQGFPHTCRTRFSQSYSQSSSQSVPQSLFLKTLFCIYLKTCKASEQIDSLETSEPWFEMSEQTLVHYNDES